MKELEQKIINATSERLLQNCDSLCFIQEAEIPFFSDTK